MILSDYYSPVWFTIHEKIYVKELFAIKLAFGGKVRHLSFGKKSDQFLFLLRTKLGTKILDP